MKKQCINRKNYFKNFLIIINSYIVTTITFKLIERINPHKPILSNDKTTNKIHRVATPNKLDVRTVLLFPIASKLLESGAWIYCKRQIGC